MKKLKRIVSLVAATALIAGAMSGCGTGKNANGKIKITIGNWSDEKTNKEDYDAMMKVKERFEKKFPQYEIVPDTYVPATDTFTMKATANQLPNLYKVHFTEPQNIIKNGYARDITEKLEKEDWLKYMNADARELLSDEDGKVYGIPTQMYATGLMINKSLFKQAGLVNEDGSVKIPRTYDEMAQYAQIIKEKTGKAGFVMPTMGNGGGWRFMNIAWSYGVNFMEEDKDGKYKATFDSQEMQNALKYVSDLKWKYNALPDDSNIGIEDSQKLFATGQAAMMYEGPSSADIFVNSYGMNIDDIVNVAVPKGPDGAYSQMGGYTIMVSTNTTDEQLDGIIEWIKFFGEANPTEFTEEQQKEYEEAIKNSVAAKRIVFAQEAFTIWNNEEINNKKNAIRAKYTNVNADNYKDFFAFNGIKIRPEEPKCCQELYAVLDGAIQEVITNKNADFASVAKTANRDFQLNHLDKEE